MIRQHLYKDALPGSPEHLEKYLEDQDIRRSKPKHPELFGLLALSFLAGSLITLLVAISF